jgi:hypothetical protein
LKKENTKLISLKATKATAGGWKCLIQVQKIQNSRGISWFHVLIAIIKQRVPKTCLIAGGKQFKS